MPSVNELSRNQALELSSDGTAAILPQIKLLAKMRGIQGVNADGSYQLGTGGFVTNDLDLSSFLLNNHVVIKSQIPVLPTNGGATNNEGDVQIQIANSMKYVGAIQDEGILDSDSIQDAEVTISALCGNMDALPLYKGRVIRAPREEEGKTTFSTKAIMWEIIDVEAKLERAVGGQIAPLYYINTDGDLTSAGTSPSGKDITFYHGITIFDENGDLRSSVTNSKPSEIQLLRVDFQEFDDDFVTLGKYTIKFTSSTQFVLTHPNNQQFTGSTTSHFDSGFVAIDSDYWNIIGDPDGVEIEFYCSYTTKGNPITIVKNLLYKAFSDDWGNNPQEPASQSVDWDRFSDYETYFNSRTIYVSETNTDNSVFDPFSDNKPLRIRDFCQRILDHVGCQLTFNSSGQISMNCDWYLLPTETVPLYQTAHTSSGDTRRPAHSIDSTGPKYNRMIAQYGFNLVTGDYSGRTTFTVAGTSKYNTLRVSFPYFKKTKNDHDVSGLNCTLWEIAKNASSVLKMSLKPNWGLPVVPGDKIEVNLTTQPVLPNSVTGAGQYWQIHRVTKRVGGLVQIEAHMIPTPGVPLRLCEWVLCQDSLGTEPLPSPDDSFSYTFPFNLA